ncbi:hypothetical protein RCL1_001967 [Eukaryota sp. TZLM3-RCL]
MLDVSSVCSYQIKDSIAATLNLDDVHDYIKNTSLAVLKRVVSRYPYMSENPGEPCLQAEGIKIDMEMKSEMALKAVPAGVRVLSFELVDLAYDQSIAKSMLAKQQAGALLGARKVIVDGATQIVSETIGSLKEHGIDFSERERSRIIANLLAVICSESAGNAGAVVQQKENNDNTEVLAKFDELNESIKALPQRFVQAQRGQ